MDHFTINLLKENFETLCVSHSWYKHLPSRSNSSGGRQGELFYIIPRYGKRWNYIIDIQKKHETWDWTTPEWHFTNELFGDLDCPILQIVKKYPVYYYSDLFVGEGYEETEEAAKSILAEIETNQLWGEVQKASNQWKESVLEQLNNLSSASKRE